MNTNVNLDAALGVLLLLGATGVIVFACAAAAHAALSGKVERARFALLVAAGAVIVYAHLLLAFSLAGRESRMLARGEEKYFCEVDCHLAYSVAGVRATPVLGAAPAEVRAHAGQKFYVVTVRTRFDPETVSPRRGDAPLAPNPRAASVIDAAGRRYEPSVEGLRALNRAGGAGTPLDTPLRPGESYTTELVFELPERIERPALLVNELNPATRLVAGHENSFLHGKTLLAVEPAATTTTNPTPRVLDWNLGPVTASIR